MLKLKCDVIHSATHLLRKSFPETHLSLFLRDFAAFKVSEIQGLFEELLMKSLTFGNRWFQK